MLLNRTLWLIETRLGADLTLRGVAAELGVTPEYLTRSFATAMGRSFMAHVRARRLTRAAEHLAMGQAPLIDVAYAAGYASPEAFARAFRAEFGRAPGAVRKAATLAGLSLIQATETVMSKHPSLSPPVIETLPARRILGSMVRYTMETRKEIPAQWAAFEYDQLPPGKVEDTWYGLCRDVGDKGDFDYLIGVEVPKGSAPKGWSKMEMPAGKWARFAATGHITTIGSVLQEIFSHWMGGPGLTPRPGPLAEVYPPTFDGATGEGGFEIWVPVV